MRVNALDTGLALDDLAAVVKPGLDGLLIPKANGVEDLQRFGHYLDALETKAGMALGSVKMAVVATETAKAMFALGSYAPAHPRLVALTWGAEDLSAALGATDNKEPDGAWTFPYQVARAQCLFAATAAEVAPIDTIHADFRDLEGLERDCRRSRRDGFTRTDGDPSRPGRDDQPLLCTLGSRDRACAPHRRSFRRQPERGNDRRRRQDGRHSALEGGAKDAGFDLMRSRETDRMSQGRPLPTEDECNAIREGVRAVVSKFDDDYWLERDEDGRFPREFHQAMAEGGWLGITMPEEYGGAGLGVTEAAIMMHEVASHGGGMAAASTVHINLFGPHPIVVKGTPEQKARWVPRLISGEDQCAFGFTEPDAGLNTTRIKTFAEKVPGGYLVRGQKVWTSTAQVASKIMLLTRTTRYEDCRRPTDGITIFYTDLDRSKIDVHRIPKMGRKAVDSNAIFIDGLFVPEQDRIGEEGKGFSYILHSLNPERILIAVEAIGIGQDALRRATAYAKERVVFDRAIGQNQGIQHPLAERWMYLEAAWLMAMKAAELYDSGKPCGAEANSAKFLGARAGHDAAWQAVMTHGGFGYAKEYHVERLYREASLTRLAPITEQLILCFIAEKVLDLPKSY